MSPRVAHTVFFAARFGGPLFCSAVDEITVACYARAQKPSNGERIMARRLQIDDRKPVQPVAPPPVDDRLNTFPPEAAAGFDVTIDPDVARRAVEEIQERQINTLLSAPGRAAMEAAFPDLAADLVRHAEAMRPSNRRVMVQRPDETAAAAAAAQERQRLEREARNEVESRARAERSARREGLGDEMLARLFQPAAPKPTIDVAGALAYLARKPAHAVEMHAVAADMASRGGQFVSARQFEYAKAICNRPRNRRLLVAEYDLSAISREEFSGGARQPARPVTTFAPGVKAGFECVIVGVPPNAVMITFGYNFEGRQSVRSISVPANRITIRGQLGDRVRCSVDAEWLLTERRIDPRLIPGSSLHGGGASAGLANTVRRRVRHMRQ